MSDNVSPLDKLEGRLQSLIEGSTARLFSSNEFQYNLSYKISSAIKDSMNMTENKGPIPPNQFNIRVHPSILDSLRSNPNFISELCDLLMEAGEDTGLVFVSHPKINFIEDSGIDPQEVFVLAHYSLNDFTQTDEYATRLSEPEIAGQMPPDAYLIIDGTTLFRIERKVINIGRRSDNHLVVDDPRVSRIHAQVRFTEDRFVIFDLNSTGGVYINGKRVQKSILRPGDVISLAGVPLVYGQEVIEDSDTQKFDLYPDKPGNPAHPPLKNSNQESE